MTDSNDDSSRAPQTSAEPSSTQHPDQAALALKTSVLADAHDLSDGAKEAASGVVNQARESAQSQISGGKDRLAESLGSVAEAIRHTGEQLREGEQSGLTDYVERAADGVGAASDYLKQKSIGDVLGDLGSFARREPAMFLGGAFVLGLLGGRFLKSSHVQPSPSPSSREPGKAQVGAGNAAPASRRQNGHNESLYSATRNAGSLPKPSDIGVGGAHRPYDGEAKMPGAL